mgnify:CR=1 FL=1
MEEKNGRCKWREVVYVKGEGIGLNIEAWFGQKIKNCVNVYRNKMPVGMVCAEGQVWLGDYLVDGVLADAVKVVLDKMPEGWHSLDEPLVVALLNVVKEAEKKLGVKIIKEV